MTTATTPASNLQFPSIDFFEAVRDALNADTDFQRSTQWFDGSVLLRIDDQRFWMKWFKGRIIDLHEGISPLGFTFSLGAPASVWEKIWTLPQDCYRPWAQLIHYGEIATEGSLIESNRVTEAVYSLFHHIHAIGSERETV